MGSCYTDKILRVRLHYAYGHIEHNLDKWEWLTEKLTFLNMGNTINLLDLLMTLCRPIISIYSNKTVTLL